MGLLVKGKWHTDWYDTESNDGEFIRQDSQFRHWITPDSEKDGFAAESGRYHLFVSLACPWAHRTLIFRALKGLEEHISVSVVKPEMLEHGWELCESDQTDVLTYLFDLYKSADKEYSGRVTVPVLWDKQTKSIVNNESAEIIRMLNSAFDKLTGNTLDFYPEDKRDAINEVNALVYETINNGVYKVGFATKQGVYEKHLKALFNALDKIEARLSKQRYLVGNDVTESDWRLFTTLIRFDSVYYGHFKTNLRQIESYPNLSNYLRDLYQQPGVDETVNFEHIKTHYYYSHDMINPTRIVPLGPKIDYARPHDRGRF